MPADSNRSEDARIEPNLHSLFFIERFYPRRLYLPPFFKARTASSMERRITLCDVKENLTFLFRVPSVGVFRVLASRRQRESLWLLVPFLQGLEKREKSESRRSSRLFRTASAVIGIPSCSARSSCDIIMKFSSLSLTVFDKLSDKLIHRHSHSIEVPVGLDCR